MPPVIAVVALYISTYGVIMGTVYLIIDYVVLEAVFWLTVASIGYSLYQQDKAKKAASRSMASSQYTTGQIDNTYSNEGIVPIVYGGPFIMGGNIIWQSDPGTTVHRFLALCVGEVDSITDVQVDEQDIAGLTGCSYTAYTGNSTQIVDSRCAGAVKGLRDLAYIAVTLAKSDKVSGNPLVSCHGTGRKVRTWNVGVQDWTTNALSASKNPAAIIRDYMLLSVVLGGCGLSLSDINSASFADFFVHCAELIDNGLVSTEARHELDIILDSKRSVLDNLLKMLMTCNATLIKSGGEYKIVFEEAEEIAVMAFTEDNITKGSFTYGYGKADETPNKLGIEWISALEPRNPKRTAWAEDELDQEVHGIREDTIECYGIIRQSQASRLAKKLLYDRKLNDIWCQFDANIEAMHCEPFDVVSVTHSRPNWTAALFRIIEINEVDFGRAKFVLQAYNSSVLDDRHGSTFDDWDYGSPPNPYEPVTDVTGIVLYEVGWRNADGTHIAHIDVEWVAPATKKELLDSYIIELKKGGADYIVVGSPPASATEYRINLNLEIDVTYYVRIKTKNSEGIISNGTVSSAITLIGKDTEPSNVSSFIVKKFRDIIVCKWVKVSDVDVQKYEIRKGTSWASGGIVATPVYGDELTVRDIKLGTDQSYWIKAIDNSGNYSVTATEAIITVGNIPFQNIIQTVEEHPAWGGLSELSNYDFELWSGGVDVAPDGWTLAGTGATIARESSIIKLGTYSAKITRVGNDCSFYQDISATKGINYWRGKTVTLGAWVYATVADRGRLTIGDGIGSSFSSFHTGNSTWQWLTVIRIIDNSATVVNANLNTETGNTSIYLDGAICVEGETLPNLAKDGNDLIIDDTYLTGTYTTTVKDIGYICEAKMMIQCIATVNESLAWDSDPTRAFDDSETLRFTGEEAPGATTFQIRTSVVGNDPNNPAHSWSAWGDWITADYNCRWYQIKMTVTRESLTTNLLISALTITADIPDIDEMQNYTITVAANGAAITFVKTFHEVPSVNVDILSGDGIVHIFSAAPTITGCTIKHLNLSGTAQTGNGRIHIHGI